MKKLLQHISLFCCACLAMPFGSCTSDRLSDSPVYTAAEVGGKVNLSLNVSIGNITGTGQTRDGEATGTIFEPNEKVLETEKINTLRIIIVRPDYTVEFNRFIDLKDRTAITLNTTNVDPEYLKFLVSTDQGYVDNNAMTCTEKKRIYLIANEASLDNFESNVAEVGKITKMLWGLTPAYYPSAKEEEEGKKGYRGDKLDPYAVERWIIYNDWRGGVGEGSETAVPIINNTGETKSYIPMTEYFDVDVVSTWKPANKVEGEDDTSDQYLRPIAEQTADLFVTRNFVKFQFSAYSDTEAFEISAIRFQSVMQQEYLFPFNTVYEPKKYGSENEVNNTVERQIVSFQTPGFADNLLRPYIFNHTDGSPVLSYTPKAPEGETGGETEGETGEETGGETGGETEDETEEEIKPVVYSPDLYFCETNSIVSTETNLQQFKVGITIKYKNGDEVTYDAVELKNLPYSLPRNTIVKVNMRIKDRKLEAVATVFPYTAVNLNPEFGFTPSPTSSLTVAPTMELDMNDPAHREGLLEATYTSTPALTDEQSKNFKLIWVSSDPSIILLGPKENDPDPTSQLYIKPAESIELPLKDGNPVEAVPVRIIPQKTGTTYVTVYSQTGLVARCKVTVK